MDYLEALSRLFFCLHFNDLALNPRSGLTSNPLILNVFLLLYSNLLMVLCLCQFDLMATDLFFPSAAECGSIATREPEPTPATGDNGQKEALGRVPLFFVYISMT